MIGVFDSGFGGLTIFKEIYKKLPQYKYIYLGDNARTPYGNRSQELIYQFSRDAVDFLFKRGCQLIIIACNTVSAESLRKLQKEYLPNKYSDRRILGVIRPVVEEAAKLSKGRIGVVGTRATVRSESFIKELNNQINNYPDKELKIFQKACPLLVPLVEEGFVNRPETKKILRYYLRPLKLKKIDTLILGCTHYPVMMKKIKDIMGKNCNVLDPGKIVAQKLQDYLERHPEIEKEIVKGSDTEFLTTNSVDIFNEIGSKLFGQKIKAKKVVLK